ncbi:23S rRNA (adenine(2503)-C(2))-methyltransferase RlmN [Desnuesiella massiliensis]|uniref:23S rRNA (adenine(2503)-C(2))-methyltransferase RlmN n=1 Tax=Desnuesiella massiliensis TaxID=1650662 RepID=UPI0006E3F3DF|nr:23S rRNA (adenine(2503)-C(2))-methyltransferase RlmN [Desnuesiella massiliensis]
MQNILDLTLDELKAKLVDLGESSFRAKQILDWVYKGVFDFSNMNNIPIKTRETLKSNFYIGVPSLIHEYQSKDGTIKILLQFGDGNIIESVIMKYKHGYSICVSTQVGCRMGCKFCASTLEGIVRNLTAGEILSQILVAQKLIQNRISNVVLMGSGEPLDNYDHVLKFLELVNAEYGLNISHRHITLSTCGIVPKILDLANRKLQLTLAISLHAYNDEKRKAIMPVANKYSINELLEACKYYVSVTGRRITFEYALVNGVNDSEEDAVALAKLLRGMLCHINLIPVNEIKENDFKKSPEERISKFMNIIKKSGIEVTVRREMGSDINAACGQLRRSYIKTQN